MEILNDAEFRRRIKKSVSSGYLFFGEEDYLKSYAATLLRDAVCGGEGNSDFNYIKLGVMDYTPEKLTETIASLPMFGEKKLIELTGFDFSSMRAEELNAFCDSLAMLEKFDYSTVLVSVAHGLIDEGKLPAKPSAIFTRLCEYLVPVRFEKCATARLCDWVGKHFEHNGVKAAPQICSKLIECCGGSMFILAGEVDKVSYYALSHGRREITEEDILTAAAPESDYDTFAFANALMSCNRPRALAILDIMKQRRIEPVIIMGEVSWVFGDLLSVRMLKDEGFDVSGISAKLKMNDYRAKLYLSAVSNATTSALSRILGLCAEADAALKLSPTGYGAIEFLICSL